MHFCIWDHANRSNGQVNMGVKHPCACTCFPATHVKLIDFYWQRFSLRVGERHQLHNLDNTRALQNYESRKGLHQEDDSIYLPP